MIESVDKTDARHTRICHVISGDLWGGAEAQALTLIRALSGRVDVCVVAFNRGELYSRIEESGIPVDLADENACGIVGLIRRVHSILGNRRPHLVHVHGFKENLVAGVAARLRGIPVVRTHHGRGMVGAGMRHTCIERLNAALLTDGLIAVSSDLADFLRLNGISLRNLRVIRNGITFPVADHWQEEGLDEASRAEPGFTIGTVGRLVPVKNHKRLLEAFKRIHDEIPVARLIIVGDGPLAGELEALAAELGISGRVSFAGFQRDVGQYLRRLDVFVLSSLHEGVPISLLEAMSMSIPVVSTRVGGVPEVITDGRNGLLVESDDAGALSSAVMKIASDRSFAKTLAGNARSTLSDELSFDRCLADTTALYNAMILKQ